MIDGGSILFDGIRMRRKLIRPEYSDDFINGWFPLGDPMAGTGSNNTLLDPNGLEAEKFYRLREVPR